jgi:hypothetical protein
MRSCIVRYRELHADVVRSDRSNSNAAAALVVPVVGHTDGAVDDQARLLGSR